MKKSTSKMSPRLPLATIAGVMLGMLTNQALAGTIIGTKHDFSASGWSGNEICIVCHTPHNSITTISTAPLWNHEPTTAVFNTYKSTTMDSTTSDPQGISRLCLSCHDGSVSYDAFSGAQDNPLGPRMSGAPAVGRNADLTDDHPISMTYDTALSNVDKGLKDPATAPVTIGETGGKTRTGVVADLMLTAGMVECSSCHDVHNGFTVSGLPGTPLLKVSKTKSALCLTCHDK